MARPPVVHDSDGRRFVVATDAGEAVLDYTRAGSVYVFTHTGVPEAMEGQSIGTRLVEAAVEHVRREGATMRPLCPFVAAYVERHPETRDLVRSSS